MNQNQNRSELLLNCPFCGCAGRIKEYDGFSVVGCSNNECPIWPDTGEDERSETIKAWNTRAVPAPSEDIQAQARQIVNDNLIDCPLDVRVRLMTEIELALTTAETKGIEKAAKVAEKWWAEKSSFGSPEVENFNTASVEIVIAIRALKAE